MDKLRRGSGLDSYGNAYQFPYEKEAIKEIECLRADRDYFKQCYEDLLARHREALKVTDGRQNKTT